MGKIELDHTGSGGGITLSSDGTDLLLDGTAIGGGGSALELYAESYDGTSTKPSATGTNAVAIGRLATASGATSIAIGNNAQAAGAQSVVVGYHSSGNPTGEGAASFGYGADAAAPYSSAIGPYSVAAGSNNFPAAIGRSYASGTDSFAAAIATNSSNYGATGSSSIAMGYRAKASGSFSSIAVGLEAVSSGRASIAMGEGAVASADSAVCLGEDSTTSGANGSIIGGYLNTASGNRSAILGGYSNAATVDYSIAMGSQAKSDKYGKIAHATGAFANAGDAQGAIYVLRADTTDATATVLTTNNSTAASTNQIVAASDTCITFDGTITAMQNGAQAYASWKIEGLLVNDGGTTTLANSATTVISNADGWGMALSADNTNNALAITVTGEASHNIRWVANIRTTEVTYA